MKNEVLDIAGVLNGFSPRVDQLNLFIVYLNYEKLNEKNIISIL